MARTLPDFPMLNATYDDEANVITRIGALNLGMATQTPNGLMVAVIRNAQDMSVWQLATRDRPAGRGRALGQGGARGTVGLVDHLVAASGRWAGSPRPR